MLVVFALLSKVWLAGCLWGNFCVQFQEFSDLYLRNSDARRCCFSFCTAILCFASLFSLVASFFPFCLPLVIRFIALFLLAQCKSSRKSSNNNNTQNTRQEHIEENQKRHISFPWALRHTESQRKWTKRVCFKPWLTAFTKYTFIIKFVVLWSCWLCSFFITCWDFFCAFFPLSTSNSFVLMFSHFELCARDVLLLLVVVVCWMYRLWVLLARLFLFLCYFSCIGIS